MASLKYWVWLAELNMRPISKVKLLDRFESPEKVYFARESEYDGELGLTEKEKNELGKKSLMEAKEIVLSCQEKGYRILTLHDAEYPYRLKSIYDPPIVLYMKGNLPEMDDEAAIAVVGTRNCTPCGVTSAEKLSYEITRGGGLIITGLARGIDTAAAMGAIRAGGRVVGVLGCGLDIVYPPENARLFDDVSKIGALVTEYSPKTRPFGGNFPMRNRIMSGLSAGVLVVEAPEKSGALITAAQALEQGRDVFAVPGSIDAEVCRGTNALLKEGAMVVTDGQDILDHYTALYPDKIAPEKRKKCEPIHPKQKEKLVQSEIDFEDRTAGSTKKDIDNSETIEYIDLVDEADNLTNDEKNIVNAMKNEASYADEIVEESGIPASKVLSALTMLELRGYVVQQHGKRFVLTKRTKSDK